ncbi:hypothetical protein C8R42DRAFT_122194 [Lentinula raphanica]|nr:hypothetical protein C8R42DRAFT_122194 [Lentinula raphanica]
MMILLRPKTTMILFAALGMLPVFALPVPDDIDQSGQAREDQGETSNSKPVDQTSPMERGSPVQISADLQLGPGAPNLRPPGGPVLLPHAACPPDFPSSYKQVEYERNTNIPEPTISEKIDRLMNSKLWNHIDSEIRQQLDKPGRVRRHVHRTKLLNGYLILAYHKNDVDAQIRWIQQTNFYRFNDSAASYYAKLINRVWFARSRLEPNDMIALGLADPSQAFSIGTFYLSGAYDRVVHDTRLLPGSTPLLPLEQP